MKRAAIGIRAHSGWGALVVVSENPVVDVIDRGRIAITDPNTRGANQPYHFAKELNLRAADQHLADCAAISEQLAFEALAGVRDQLWRREYVAVGCAILLASGRALPSLSNILASHALIHTAEGEFFRQAFFRASERLEIPATGIRERDLDQRAEAVFGDRASRLRQEIAALGRSLGPPWTTDQKTASLAALLVLAGDR
ncbi:MAG: hypothetical protein ABSB86_03805 [Bryobacteraceae bacterium]|jgi:hypothetical protein